MEYFADVSNHNYKYWMKYEDYVAFLKSAHQKYNIKSTCVLLSDGVNFQNPVRKEQTWASYKTFGSFSCYHFFRGNVKAEANNFLSALKSVGADKSTVLMIDAETPLADLTAKINQFINILYDNGFHHIYVYSMGSMFNYRNNGIQTGELKHGAKVWIASYGVNTKPSGADAWQFTSTANAYSVPFDLDIDYVGELSKGIKPEKSTYLSKGKAFKSKCLIHIYREKKFKNKRLSVFGPNSVFYGKPIKVGSIYRIKTHTGYVSANTDFVKQVK